MYYKCQRLECEWYWVLLARWTAEVASRARQRCNGIESLSVAGSRRIAQQQVPDMLLWISPAGAAQAQTYLVTEVETVVSIARA